MNRALSIGQTPIPILRARRRIARMHGQPARGGLLHEQAEDRAALRAAQYTAMADHRGAQRLAELQEARA